MTWTAVGACVFVVAAAVLAVCPVHVVPAAERSVGVDAKALIGDWMGSWRSSTGSTDNLNVTIDAVEGAEVRGSIFMAVATPGLGYYNRDVPFSGMFDGTELRFWVPPALWFSLKVIGERMHGSVQGQQTFGTVDLAKRR